MCEHVQRARNKNFKLPSSQRRQQRARKLALVPEHKVRARTFGNMKTADLPTAAPEPAFESCCCRELFLHWSKVSAKIIAELIESIGHLNLPMDHTKVINERK